MDTGGDDDDDASDDNDIDNDDDDTDDNDLVRTTLRFSNTAHVLVLVVLVVVVVVATARLLSFALDLILFRPFLLLFFRCVSVLCELEKYDVNFFNTPTWALLSFIVVVLSMSSSSMIAVVVVGVAFASAIDDTIDVK